MARRSARQSRLCVAAAAIETLEGRRLLSASACECQCETSGGDGATGGHPAPVLTLEGGVLTIDGTDGNDVIRVSADAHFLSYEVNGLMGNMGSGEAVSVVVHGFGGDDLIMVDNANGMFAYDVAFMGGAGNDTLIGGAGSDMLSGEEGEDQITGGGGMDVLEQGSEDPLGSGDGDGCHRHTRGRGHEHHCQCRQQHGDDHRGYGYGSRERRDAKCDNHHAGKRK